MMRCGVGCAWLLAVWCGSALDVRAGLLTFIDNRRAFERALVADSDSTIVDTHGLFSADPEPRTRVPVLLRSGLVNGMPFEFSVYDIDFSTDPSGVLEPGVVGGDIADLDHFGIETPVSQDGAQGNGSWGIDSLGGATTSRNGLLIDFTQTPADRGVGHFGVELHDFEATMATPGSLRVYQDGRLTFHQDLAWGDDNGDGTSHFIGVVATQPNSFFDQVAVVVGDHGSGTGYGQRWAADRITFGQASNPEPHSLVMVCTLACLFGAVYWYQGRCRLTVRASRAGKSVHS